MDTGPTMTFAEWLVEDPTIAMTEEDFRKVQGMRADQKMDRATLDARIASTTEILAAGEPPEDEGALAARKAEDEGVVAARKAKEAEAEAARKAAVDKAKATEDNNRRRG